MQLQLLAVAFGLASLAGINLYLTVFVTGLAIDQQWVVLAPQYQGLAVLGHPAIVAIAGILYFLQFFADKVPWVDSLWDTVHTVIRPIGGAMLALHTLGHMNPVFDVIVALLAGTAALTTHGLKAGTRLIANTSPEPFSNIALSVSEDAIVIGGLALLHYNPLLALVILLVFFACIVYFGPKMFRVITTRLWLVWRKLNAPASDKTAEGGLTAALPAEHDILFTRLNLLGEKIEWTARCISTAAPRIPGNRSGFLIATVEEPRKLYFVAKSGWGKIAETLELEGCKAVQESKFLTENLVIYHPAKKIKYTFLFDRTKTALVRNLVASLERRLGSTAVVESVPTSKVEPQMETSAK
jgi:hypothetical protein